MNISVKMGNKFQTEFEWQSRIECESGQWSDSCMMRRTHVCFFPTEIILYIFALVGEDKLRHGSRPTLAALARTCRTFKEPALDLLWANITGFKPLLSCLPDGVIIIPNTTEGEFVS